MWETLSSVKVAHKTVPFGTDDHDDVWLRVSSGRQVWAAAHVDAAWATAVCQSTLTLYTNRSVKSTGVGAGPVPPARAATSTEPDASAEPPRHDVDNLVRTSAAEPVNQTRDRPVVSGLGSVPVSGSGHGDDGAECDPHWRQHLARWTQPPSDFDARWLVFKV